MLLFYFRKCSHIHAAVWLLHTAILRNKVCIVVAMYRVYEERKLDLDLWANNEKQKGETCLVGEPLHKSHIPNTDICAAP